jgi:hypothetical protein
MLSRWTKEVNEEDPWSSERLQYKLKKDEKKRID